MLFELDNAPPWCFDGSLPLENCISGLAARSTVTGKVWKRFCEYYLFVSLMFHPFFLEIYLSSCLGRFLSSFRKWNVKQNLGSIQAATALPNAQNAIFKMGMWARGHSWPIKTWMEFSHWSLKNICLKFVFYQEILPFVVLVYVQRRDPPSPQGNTSISIFRERKSIFSAATASCREKQF